MECYVMKWKEAESLIDEVAKQIKKDDYAPDLVIGMSRGGVVPARMICDKLHLSNLVSIKAEHWGVTGEITGEAKITHGLKQSLKEKSVLIVDDLTDTGDSLQKAIEHIQELNPKEIKTAVVEHKKTSKIVPDYYSREITDWKWIIYPWEFNENISQLIQKIMEKEMTADEIDEALKNTYGLEIPSIIVLELLENMEHWGKVKREIEKEHIYWVKK